MAVIFWLSAQSDPGPDLGTLVGIASHFCEFALLAALWAWALLPVLGRTALAAAAAIALLYALSDEFHQSFVPGRDADPLDLLVDAAGIATALGLISRLPLAREARSRRTARRAPPPPA